MTKQLRDILKWQIEAGLANSFSMEQNYSPKLEQQESKNYNAPLDSQNLTAALNLGEKPAQIIKPKTITPSNLQLNDNSDSVNSYIKKAEKLASEAKNLDELKAAIESFDGLAIKKTATNCVFADGNSKSDLMLIGEAPGENEDVKGIPFCGVSGRLLDKMFKFAGYTRERNFYITNTVFWRPPGNRKPTPDEVAMCKPFLARHIELVNPKVIVLVGATATFSILNSNKSISLLKKDMHKYENKGKETACFAIYHPSYLLRQPTQKKNAWSDILNIKKYIEQN